MITSKEAALKLGVSTQTLSNWRKQGKIDFVKESERRIFYNEHDIQDLINHYKSFNNHITSKEAALKLGVSTQTLSNWRKQGKIDFVKESERRIFYKSLVPKKKINSHVIYDFDSFLKKWFLDIIVYIHPNEIKKSWYVNFSNYFDGSTMVYLTNQNTIIDILTDEVLITENNLVNFLNKSLNPKVELLIDETQMINFIKSKVNHWL